MTNCLAGSGSSCEWTCQPAKSRWKPAASIRIASLGAEAWAKGGNLMMLDRLDMCVLPAGDVKPKTADALPTMCLMIMK